MAYIFGHDEPDLVLSSARAATLLKQAKAASRRLRETPIQGIIDSLGKVGELWQPGGRYYQRALRKLKDEIAFSEGMIEQTLAIIPLLFRRETLLQRLRAELDDECILDCFSSRHDFDGLIKAVPLGVILHVSAGNVFISCIDSLLMGFITKNVSVVKLSSRNRQFPRIFAESIQEADASGILASSFAVVHWQGGDHEVESVFKEHADGIIAWGGEAMVRSYRTGLAPGVKLIDYGPKLSFQVITSQGHDGTDLVEIASRIARDVCLWDQAACASPQNLFVEHGIDIPNLMIAIGKALDGFPVRRGRLDDDECVEILKEKFRAKLSALTAGGAYREGADWLLHWDPKPGLRPSPLNRTLIIHTFKNHEDLRDQVAPYASYLQSCGYLASSLEKEDLRNTLASTGVQRFAQLGKMMESVTGAPHDGRYPLMEMVRLVPEEGREDLMSFVNDAIRHVPFYRQLYAGNDVRSPTQLIPITGDDLGKHSLSHSTVLLREGPRHGRIFASGGTSGKAKYAYFSPEEFRAVAKMLAKGYRAQGLGNGDICANLFVAGNMWSSFMAVDQALEICKATVLPIGGAASHQLILQYFLEFKPRFVFGLPSLLVAIADESNKRGLKIHIPYVCYAGEHLNQNARTLLAAAWKVERCFSAGYASVDAGPIGYQCLYLADREHHLFEDDVHLAIEDDEAIVTSKVRRLMPVIHYRTGDHVEWSLDQGLCACGSSEKRFILHGRKDGQMNVWSCRVNLADIEQALVDCGIEASVWQVVISDGNIDGCPDDIITITVEGQSISSEMAAKFSNALRQHSKDLLAIHSAEHLQRRVVLKSASSGAIARVERTGKTLSLIDKRLV